MKTDISHLEESQISEPFSICNKAHFDLTGVQLTFVSREALEADWHSVVVGNSVCRLMIGCCHSCAAHRDRLFANTDGSPIRVRTLLCPTGLTVSTVAATSPNGAPGYLCVGPVVVKTRSDCRIIDTIAERLRAAFPTLSSPALRQLVTAVPTFTVGKWRTTLSLLGFFAGHAQSIRSGSSSALSASGHFSSCVARARRIITERFREELHLEQVAREVGASPCHLSRQFHAQTGTSFSDALKNARVAELKRLLREAEAPNITTLIFNAGFQSVSQANRAFRSSVGMCPREFRASHRG